MKNESIECFESGTDEDEVLGFLPQFPHTLLIPSSWLGQFNNKTISEFIRERSRQHKQAVLVSSLDLEKKVSDLTFPERRKLAQQFGLLTLTTEDLQYRLSTMASLVHYNQKFTSAISSDIALCGLLLTESLLLRRSITSPLYFGPLFLFLGGLSVIAIEHYTLAKTFKRALSDLPTNLNERNESHNSFVIPNQTKMSFVDCAIRAAEMDIAINKYKRENATSLMLKLFITPGGNNLTDLTLQTRWLAFYRTIKNDLQQEKKIPTQ